MENLPDEMLIEIFSYFSMKSQSILIQVCKRWSELIMNTAKLNSFFILSSENDMMFLKWWPRNYEIRTLVISMEVDLINSLFIQLEVLCPYLVSLTISKKNVLSERHIYRLNQCFPKLQHVDVFLTSYFVNSCFLRILDKKDSVVLNNKLDDTTLKVICENCPDLRELHMYGYVEYYPLSQLHNILTLRFNQLRKLTLRCYEVNDKTCQLLAKCTNLESLYMYHCWLLTDVGLSHLADLEYLNTLHLTGLKLITQKGFERFVRAVNLKKVTELNFSCSLFNDHHALILSEKKSKLRTLELWNCINLTNVGVSCLVQQIKTLQSIDLNMSLGDNVLKQIVFQSDIIFCRCKFATCVSTLSEWQKHRPLELSPAFICYDEDHFRGNSEGVRANYLRYSYHFQSPHFTGNFLEISGF